MMIEPMKKLKFTYFSCVILQAIFKYTISCWMLRYLRSCQRFTHNFFTWIDFLFIFPRFHLRKTSFFLNDDFVIDEFVSWKKYFIFELHARFIDFSRAGWLLSLRLMDDDKKFVLNFNLDTFTTKEKKNYISEEKMVKFQEKMKSNVNRWYSKFLLQSLMTWWWYDDSCFCYATIFFKVICNKRRYENNITRCIGSLTVPIVLENSFGISIAQSFFIILFISKWLAIYWPKMAQGKIYLNCEIKGIDRESVLKKRRIKIKSCIIFCYFSIMLGIFYP